MNRRTMITLTGIAIALTMQNGCAVNNPSVVNEPTAGKPKVIATPDAQFELNKRKVAGNSSWAIVCNGTCMGAPALAFFDSSEAADDSVAVKVLDGIEIVVEPQAMDLVDKWGEIVIRCMNPGSRDIVVEFAKTQSGQ